MSDIECPGCGHKFSEPTGALDAPKARKLTPQQKIVRAFKEAKGIDANDAGWDRKFFARFIRPANEVLTAFDDDVDRAMAFILVKGAEWSNLTDWGLEAVIRAAAREYKRIGGNDGSEDGKVDAVDMVGPGRRRRLTSSREVVGDTLGSIERAHISGQGTGDVAGPKPDYGHDPEDFS